METLLTGYLLSAQGDRVQMAHGVETRFPFLDRAVLELAARIPPRLKLRGLREKWILRRCARRWLPEALLLRVKFPYRAPVAPGLAGPVAAPWTEEAFAPERLREVGVFDGEKVARLRARLAARPEAATEVEAMALMAVASTQLLASIFVGAGVAATTCGDFVLEAA
jgi:asparagine synthase (glutamine-hydrolysing)